MLTVGVNQLRRNLGQFLQRVQAGERVIITVRGHRVAQLTPLNKPRQQAREALQQLRENAVIGDVVSPLDEEWEALQ
jgi:prevent-host-death family protein